MNPVAERLGEVGLPEPLADLAARDWDAVVVGGGHNGLTAAAYLARAGLSVLVLERRERLGGACTLERPFADERFVVSPCAYVLGLLDDRVIEDLDLRGRGLRWWIADPNLWIPFPDGTALGQFVDDARTAESLRSLGVSRADVDGYWAHQELFAEARRLLREGPRDAWEGDCPGRDELESMLGGRSELVDLVFGASIAEVMEEHFSDRRLHDALFGGGVIGTWAGPRDPGTAGVKLMLHLGNLDGADSNWAYVEGGMGMVSFAIADAAHDAGAVLACGVPVARILPGEGVEAEDGTVIRARAVVSNADPVTTLGMLGRDAVAAHDPDYLRRLEGWDVRSPVVKLNAALERLPDWSAAGLGETWPARAMIELTDGLDAAQDAFAACAGGEPAIGFAEVYTQTGFDPSPAPPGRHSMTVFAQYAPHGLAAGDWASRRDEVGRLILALIDRFAPGIEDRIIDMEVLGPPDIEERIGLAGGHIFQGQVTPEQMWDRRLSPRTPVPGVYLCGAATHPGGSVIATNGRNAASALLADERASGG